MIARRHKVTAIAAPGHKALVFSHWTKSGKPKFKEEMSLSWVVFEPDGDTIRPLSYHYSADEAIAECQRIRNPGNHLASQAHDPPRRVIVVLAEDGSTVLAGIAADVEVGNLLELTRAVGHKRVILEEVER